MILTVGDGLVTQIPALIVSTAAGLLVSKAGVVGAADKALLKQLSGYPKALGMSGAVMLVMALLPSVPRARQRRQADRGSGGEENRKQRQGLGGIRPADR